MTSIDVLRRAQGEILNLQAYIATIEPKATAFDLLVRTHLGRTGSDVAGRRAAVDMLEEEIAAIQLNAAADAEEAAAKEAAKKAKVKKPRKPRTPKPPAVEVAGTGDGGEPAGPQEQPGTGQFPKQFPEPTTDDAPAPAVNTEVSKGRRRRGIFIGPAQ